MNKRMLITCLTLATSISLTLSTPVSADFGSEDMPQELLQKLDRNGDGKIGPEEKALAQKLHSRIDLNDDGRIGLREHRANHRFLTQVDRRR